MLELSVDFARSMMTSEAQQVPRAFRETGPTVCRCHVAFGLARWRRAGRGNVHGFVDEAASSLCCTCLALNITVARVREHEADQPFFGSPGGWAGGFFRLRSNSPLAAPSYRRVGRSDVSLWLLMVPRTGSAC